MDFLRRFGFVLTLSIGFTATSALALEIRQPSSVLPWRAPPTAAALELKPAAPIRDNEPPAWFIDSDWQSPRKLPVQEGLPMVEAENFAHLGQLHPQSNSLQSTTRQLGSAQQNRANLATERRPFNWFRALGIQAKRPNNRR